MCDGDGECGFEREGFRELMIPSVASAFYYETRECKTLLKEQNQSKHLLPQYTVSGYEMTSHQQFDYLMVIICVKTTKPG